MVVRGTARPSQRSSFIFQIELYLMICAVQRSKFCSFVDRIKLLQKNLWFPAAMSRGENGGCD